MDNDDPNPEPANPAAAEVEQSGGATIATSDALALAEQAEAEAAEAEAQLAAARARAEAIRQRIKATAAVEDTGDAAEQAGPVEPGVARQRPTKPLAMGIAAVSAIVVLLGASGWMAWRHHEAVQDRQRAAAYLTTARQGVIDLTSLDFTKSKEGTQRILDIATTEFRNQFRRTAEDFASFVKDTRAVTEGSLIDAAVESMNKDSAVVLVLARERVTSAAGVKDRSRTFRFRVSVVHEGDRLKISKLGLVL